MVSVCARGRCDGGGGGGGGDLGRVEWRMQVEVVWKAAGVGRKRNRFQPRSDRAEQLESCDCRLQPARLPPTREEELQGCSASDAPRETPRRESSTV